MILSSCIRTAIVAISICGLPALSANTARIEITRQHALWLSGVHPLATVAEADGVYAVGLAGQEVYRTKIWDHADLALGVWRGRLLYSQDRNLWLGNLYTGRSELLLEDVAVHRAAWSPSQNSFALIYSREGRSVLQLGSLSGMGPEVDAPGLQLDFLRWSQDGSTLLYLRQVGEGEETQLSLVRRSMRSGPDSASPLDPRDRPFLALASDTELMANPVELLGRGRFGDGAFFGEYDGAGRASLRFAASGMVLGDPGTAIVTHRGIVFDRDSELAGWVYGSETVAVSPRSGGAKPGSALRAVAPANDEPAGATIIGVLPFSTTQSMTDATNNVTDPPTACGVPGKTLWFRYTAAATGYVMFDTVGSTVTDTWIGVYEGTTIPGTEVGCNQNGTGTGLQARIHQRVIVGQSYLIMVVGSLLASGNLTFNAAAGTNTAPTVPTFSPMNTKGIQDVVTVRATDVNGFRDVGQVTLQFSTTTSGANSCKVIYDIAANQVRLRNDADNSDAGAGAPGSAGLLTNTQCQIDLANTSTAGSANTRTLNVAVRFFQAAFSGVKKVMTRSVDASNAATSLTEVTTWNIALGPDTVSTTVPVGAVPSATFQASYHGDGVNELQWVQFLIAASGPAMPYCFVHYDVAANTLWMWGDGGFFQGPVPIGTSSPDLRSSTCAVDSLDAFRTWSGNTLTLTIPIAFKSALAGAKVIYMRAYDRGEIDTGWVNKADMTAGVPPVPNSEIRPASETGSARLFEGQFVQAAEFDGQNYGWVEMAFASSLATPPVCLIHYDRYGNGLWLYGPGGFFLGPVSPGTDSNALETTACKVDPKFMTQDLSTGVIAWDVPVIFSPGFTGARKVWLRQMTAIGVDTDWQEKGTYTVTTGQNTAGISPFAAAGSSAAFKALHYHPTGNNSFRWTQMLIASNSTPGGSDPFCLVHYDKIGNALWLYKDGATGFVGPVTPGTASNLLDNANCTVNTAGSSVSTSSKMLQVTIPIQFKAPMAGARSIFQRQLDLSDADTGWQTRGGFFVSP